MNALQYRARAHAVDNTYRWCLQVAEAGLRRLAARGTYHSFASCKRKPGLQYMRGANTLQTVYVC